MHKRLLFSRSNKRSRAQVNAVKEDSKEEEQEREFRTMEQAVIISRSTGSPWVASLHMVKN